MKILILGAYGMLGHTLYYQLSKKHQVSVTCREIRNDSLAERFISLNNGNIFVKVMVEDFKSVINAVENCSPDVVINCIGVIKQKKEALSPIPSLKINSIFPHELAEYCLPKGIRVIHFSTDCVFNGRKGNYSEADISDAEDLYGRSKYLGELSYPGTLTIRSSIVGKELGTTMGLFEWFLANRNGSVWGYKNAIYSGFTTLEMANILDKIIIQFPDLSGVYQVASTPINKYDLLSLLNQKMNLNIDIRPEEKFFCDRSLLSTKFNQIVDYQPPTWDEMLNEFVSFSALYES